MQLPAYRRAPLTSVGAVSLDGHCKHTDVLKIRATTEKSPTSPLLLLPLLALRLILPLVWPLQKPAPQGQ